MLPLPRISFLNVAPVCALVALTASNSPARADDLVQNLGSVGPHEPILTTVGSKSVIAFYWPDGGDCAVHVVVRSSADVNAESTTGFQATLKPRQIAPITTAENKLLYLQCGYNAENLAIVHTTKFIAVGTTTHTAHD